jgi:LysM repeat protein
MQQSSPWRRWLRNTAWALSLAFVTATDAADSTDQEYEERFRRLNTTVEDLLGAQATLQKRIGALSDELRTVRDEQERAPNRYVRHDDLRKALDRLAEKIRELDQKREDDKRLILDEIRKLAQAPLPEPPPRRAKDREPQPLAPAPGPMKGYEYVVKSGDTLVAIIAAYQQSGVKVTQAQVQKANPGLNPNRLGIGQKVFIPDPSAP